MNTIAEDIKTANRNINDLARLQTFIAAVETDDELRSALRMKLAVKQLSSLNIKQKVLVR